LLPATLAEQSSLISLNRAYEVQPRTPAKTLSSKTVIEFAAYLENDFLEKYTVQSVLLCHHSATRADFKVVRNGQKPTKSLIYMVPPHGLEPRTY